MSEFIKPIINPLMRFFVIYFLGCRVCRSCGERTVLHKKVCGFCRGEIKST